MPIQKTYPQRKGPDGALANNWFSCRHKTSEACRDARNAYKDRIIERQLEAKERQEYRKTLRPEDQLKILDKRLGKDQGAQRERAKLKKQIASRKK